MGLMGCCLSLKQGWGAVCIFLVVVMDGRVAQRNTQQFRASTHKSVASSSHPSCHTSAHTSRLLACICPWRYAAVLCNAIHPMPALASARRLLKVSRDRCGSHAPRLGPIMHLARLTAGLDSPATPSPPSTSPARPESRFLPSASHPFSICVLPSWLSSVVRCTVCTGPCCLPFVLAVCYLSIAQLAVCCLSPIAFSAARLDRCDRPERGPEETSRPHRPRHRPLAPPLASSIRCLSSSTPCSSHLV